MEREKEGGREGGRAGGKAGGRAIAGGPAGRRDGGSVGERGWMGARELVCLADAHPLHPHCRGSEESTQGR